MQTTSRHDAKKTLDSLVYLKARYQCLEMDIIRLSSKTEYEQSIKQYDYMIAKLTEEVRAMPIGYKYTGTFYLKKPLLLPAEFLKCEGVLYMREDLVSWEIKEGVGFPNQGYYRTVYKQPVHGTEITRADAIPVYAKNCEPVKVMAT